MNIVYIVGIVMAFFFTVFGIVVGFDMSTLQFSFSIENLKNFVDLSSILIVIGGTLAVVVAAIPSRSGPCQSTLRSCSTPTPLIRRCMWIS